MTDRRELPTYTISEAAHYLSVPAATIRYWSVGRGRHLPLIDVRSPGPPTLVSFLNLTELHVLAALRRRHRVKMPAIREAIEHLSTLAQTPIDARHPLVSRVLATDGVHVFTDYYGQLINLSRFSPVPARDRRRGMNDLGAGCPEGTRIELLALYLPREGLEGIGEEIRPPRAATGRLLSARSVRLLAGRPACRRSPVVRPRSPFPVGR